MIMLPNFTFCLHLLISISFSLFVGRVKMRTGTPSAVNWLCKDIIND